MVMIYRKVCKVLKDSRVDSTPSHLPGECRCCFSSHHLPHGRLNFKTRWERALYEEGKNPYLPNQIIYSGCNDTPSRMLSSMATISMRDYC